MIIVEGCDNAGKTTLVHRLSDELKLLTVLNRRRPKSLDESWDYLIRIMPAMSQLPSIMDRFMAISEPIYGPICRGTSIYTNENIKDQMRFVVRSLQFQPLIIYCRPALSRILDFGDRAQMPGVIENAKAIVDGYDERIAWLGTTLHLPIVFYDYEQSAAYDRVLSSARAHIGANYK